MSPGLPDVIPQVDAVKVSGKVVGVSASGRRHQSGQPVDHVHQASEGGARSCCREQAPAGAVDEGYCSVSPWDVDTRKYL